MYHDIYLQSPEESGLSTGLYKIKIDEFERQIETIKQIEGDHPNTISLTFDDGGSSFFSPIAEILDKYQLKGYFFIATKHIGTNGFITREQIKDIDSRGHFIGSHSHSHPENILSLSDDEIDNEWRCSISILEAIVGHQIHVASIPNGYQARKVLESANRCGIKELFTSRPGCEERKFKDIVVKGRFVVLNGMTSKDIIDITSDSFTRWKLLVKWSALNVLKSFLGTRYEPIKQKIMR